MYGAPCAIAARRLASHAASARAPDAAPHACPGRCDPDRCLDGTETAIFRFSGAPGRIRTCDRRIRSPLLCPLSYGGVWSAARRRSDGTRCRSQAPLAPSHNSLEFGLAGRPPPGVDADMACGGGSTPRAYACRTLHFAHAFMRWQARARHGNADDPTTERISVGTER